jgi:hypothetical protein
MVRCGCGCGYLTGYNSVFTSARERHWRDIMRDDAFSEMPSYPISSASIPKVYILYSAIMLVQMQYVKRQLSGDRLRAELLRVRKPGAAKSGRSGGEMWGNQLDQLHPFDWIILPRHQSLPLMWLVLLRCNHASEGVRKSCAPGPIPGYSGSPLYL